MDKVDGRMGEMEREDDWGKEEMRATTDTRRLNWSAIKSLEQPD